MATNIFFFFYKILVMKKSKHLISMIKIKSKQKCCNISLNLTVYKKKRKTILDMNIFLILKIPKRENPQKNKRV